MTAMSWTKSSVIVLLGALLAVGLYLLSQVPVMVK
jgi:hypothetical protein